MLSVLKSTQASKHEFFSILFLFFDIANASSSDPGMINLILFFL